MPFAQSEALASQLGQSRTPDYEAAPGSARDALGASLRGVEGIETRMVGREAELKHLQDAFRTACEDAELQVVTITGDAGVGKSRLLYEFDLWSELLPEQFYYFKGRAAPEMQGLPHSLIRDLLAFEPENNGTDIKLALDSVNQILKRRSIVFLVSDFMDDPQRYRKSMFMANRKHDLIAIDLHDPLETEIADVGMLALEDAESGELIWLDTSEPAWRERFAQRTGRFEAAKRKTLADDEAVEGLVAKVVKVISAP